MQISASVNHLAYQPMSGMRFTTVVYVTSLPVGGSAPMVAGSQI